jgi:hypothetical protein
LISDFIIRAPDFGLKEGACMENDGSDGSRDMWYLVGGIALLVAGAGLIMAHPIVRRQLREGLNRAFPGGIPEGLTSGLSTVVPDFQRYLKMRAM